MKHIGKLHKIKGELKPFTKNNSSPSIPLCKQGSALFHP
jgi:hypothetical protein